MNTLNNSKNTMEEIIIDVRSIGEWNMDGHADCSVNIPIDQLESHLDELMNFKKIVLVCRSGNRAGMAMSILKNAGFKGLVENLGPWQNITCKHLENELS